MSEDTNGHKKRTSVVYVIILALILIFVIFLRTINKIDSTRPAARWSEGKALMYAIATEIRAYAEKIGINGESPPDNDFGVLGFEKGDLDGTYFNQTTDKMFSYTVSSLNPLKFTITVVNEDLEPRVITLDQDGIWTEKNELQNIPKEN